MKSIGEKQDKVVIRAVSRDEEGKKKVEKTELSTHNIDTVKYVEKKKMKSIGEKQDKVVIRAVSRDEEGKKKVEKTELSTHNIDTVKYVEKKLVDKGVQRLERHPANGIGLRKLPKSGHGGKYTWEGPDEIAENELGAVPPAVDEKDPNYVDEEEEEKVVKGKKEDVAGLVVGEVEVAKVAEEEEGVARIEVDPRLKVN